MIRVRRLNPFGFRKKSGYSLVELLTIIMIIALLAGFVVLSVDSDGAEATKVLSDLDALRTAMLAYAAEHPSRIADPLSGWDAADSSTIRASLDQYMERAIDYPLGVEYADNTDYPEYPNGAIVLEFDGFKVTSRLAEALNKAVADNKSYAGDYSASEGKYTLGLMVR